MTFNKRGAGYADEAFVYATWLRSLYYGNSTFRKIDKDRFFKTYPNVIKALLTRSNVDVVCLEDDPEVLLGYAVYEGEALHFLYVKKAWRKLGIARMLMPGNVTKVTHLTKVGEKLLPKGIKFDPFL